MRYAQRGGYTPAEQQRRERLRLEAAGRFAGGDEISEIAQDLRVTPRERYEVSLGLAALLECKRSCKSSQRGF